MVLFFRPTEGRREGGLLLSDPLALVEIKKKLLQDPKVVVIACNLNRNFYLPDRVTFL